MQNGPKMSVYQQINSNQQPITYSLNQTQPTHSCPFSLLQLLPCPDLEWQQWDHDLLRGWELWEVSSPSLPTSQQRHESGGEDSCVGWRKTEHGSSTHPLEIPCPGCTLPASQILPAPLILPAPTSWLLPALFLMPLPHAGMRASTRWLVCNSLSHCSESEPGMLLAQVNQSLLPAQL